MSGVNSPLNLVCTQEMKDYFGTSFDISLDQEIFNLKDELRDIRRYLHSIAELSFKEFQTSKYIINYIENLNKTNNSGIANKLIFHTGSNTFGERSQTGVTCLLKGTKTPHLDYCIGLRADIDALPIDERNADIDFKSLNKDVMHACGHDAHTAILLITMKILHKHSNKLNGNVRFLFQPGEEVGGGAIDLIEHGKVLSDVNQVYGLHVAATLDRCTISINKEPKALLSGCSNVKIIIHGKGGHGSMPHLANDVIVAMSSLIQQLQTIVSRNIDPNEMGVVTIGKIESGYKCNVIADKAVLEGTLRYFNIDNSSIIKQRVLDICDGIERSFKVRIEVIYDHPGYPPTINKDIGFNNVCNTAMKIVGNNGLETDLTPIPASEDFSEYINVRDGAFFFLGAKVEPPKDRPDEIYMHHAPNFKIDERCMPVGCQMFVQLVFDIFEQRMKQPGAKNNQNRMLAKL